MANPDDEGFENFVNDMMNASFSSAVDLRDLEHEELENCILHNVSASESDNEDENEENDNQLSTRPIGEWFDVTDNDPGHNHVIQIFNINHGPNLPISFTVDTKPVEFFKLFFNDDIIKHICMETNLFANKKKAETHSPHARLNKWEDITPLEMYAFLGCILNMGLIPLPSIESYFSTNWMRRVPFFSSVFSKNKFMNLFYHLHFNHVERGNVCRPRGFLIQPIVEHIQEMCKLFYTPSNNVAVDESTISFKGKVSFRIYNKNKPTKFGLKVFVLSDSDNGYVYNFMPYFGREELIPNSRLLKTTQIVKLLTQSVVNKDSNNPTSGLHVYTDRYYTSPQLAQELLNMNVFLTGTVMTNRTGLPVGLKRTQRNMRKGDIISKRKGDVLVVSWKDKRVVTVLSSNNKGSKHDMTEVASKWPNQPPTRKPNVVLDYTKRMGAVDRSDHFVSSYQFLRKSKKWYRKMFFWLLEVGLVDAYLLYKATQEDNNKKPLSHLQFRYSVIEDLVTEKVAQQAALKKRGGRLPQGPPEQRLDGSQHFMGRTKKGTKCLVCAKKGIRKETIYHCKTCIPNVNLHPDECFEAYHTKHNYWM